MQRLVIVLVGLLVLGSGSASAQGLLWKLPEQDGTWIRFEGDYTEQVNRPDTSEGSNSFTWKRWVTIKSVGREDATYKDKLQPCRWIEIKVETGKTPEGVLDAGPGGNRIYKILVPESAIRGTVNEPVGEGREVLAAFIPFVKGYRKLGDEPAAELSSGVFDLYPVTSLLRHYRNLEPAGEAQSLAIAQQTVNATEYKGSLQSETPTYRSVSTADIFRSQEMPFGVAKWTASVVTSEKGSTDPRSAFKEVKSMKEELQAVAIGADAESELLVN